MAQPISLDLPPRNDWEHIRSRLRDAPAEHADALLAVYGILQSLDDHGVLDWIQGALGASSRVIGLATDAAKQPESVRALRNVTILAKLFGQIEPAALARLSDALREAASTVGSQPRKAPGLWAVLRDFWNPDVRRGLREVTRLLAAIGSATARSQERG